MAIEKKSVHYLFPNGVSISETSYTSRKMGGGGLKNFHHLSDFPPTLLFFCGRGQNVSIFQCGEGKSVSRRQRGRSRCFSQYLVLYVLCGLEFWKVKFRVVICQKMHVVPWWPICDRKRRGREKAFFFVSLPRSIPVFTTFKTRD